MHLVAADLLESERESKGVFVRSRGKQQKGWWYREILMMLKNDETETLSTRSDDCRDC